MQYYDSQFWGFVADLTVIRGCKAFVRDGVIIISRDGKEFSVVEALTECYGQGVSIPNRDDLHKAVSNQKGHDAVLRARLLHHLGLPDETVF